MSPSLPLTFPPVDAVLLPPPWPAVTAWLLVAGALWWGRQAARWLAPRRRGSAPWDTPAALGWPAGRVRPIDVAAGYVLILGATGTLVHLLALAGLANPGALRALALMLAAPAAAWLTRGARRSISGHADRLRQRFIEAGALDRWLLAGSAVTILALAAGAMGPTTDADSAAYHLSVPLAWLSHGGAWPTPDWFHSRLVGLGEGLNLLGLAAGTDCFGALLQVSGVCVAVVSLQAVAATPRDRATAAALVCCCPLLAGLSFTAKSQLLPAAASVTAFALTVDLWRRGEVPVLRSLLPIIGCSAFALACKLSFLPGMVALSALTAAVCWRRGSPGTAVVAGLIAFTVFPLPQYLRTALFYGDPLSPALERFRQHPDLLVSTFAWYLRHFNQRDSLAALLSTPWSLVVPTGPDQLHAVLGLGTVAAMVAVAGAATTWPLLLAIAVPALSTALLSQRDARFFFEPYLWMGVAALASPWRRARGLVASAVAIQLAAGVVMASYGAAILTPAAWTSDRRADVLQRYGPDHALWQWLDRVLDPAAVVAADRRSVLFSTRPVVPPDVASMVEFLRRSQVSDPAWSLEAGRARLTALLAGAQVTTIVATLPLDQSLFSPLASRATLRLVSPEFEDASRSPWSEGSRYRVGVFDLAPPDRQATATPSLAGNRAAVPAASVRFRDTRERPDQ